MLSRQPETTLPSCFGSSSSGISSAAGSGLL
jgi:hypothetical protein